MSEELDKAAEAFLPEVDPPARPRDQAGKFVETLAKPEAMFADREIEGEGDAGDDQNLRRREKEAKRGSDKRNLRADTDSPSRIGDRELEPADAGEGGELDADELAAAEGRQVAEPEADDGEKYEVIIDGQPHQVTLSEALNGYIRQETFHRRLTELNNLRAGLEEDSKRQQANWTLMLKVKEEYENDVKTMLPPEPDWDREFAINPVAAHQNQKVYQALYAKLNQSIQERNRIEAIRAEEADRQLKKYAVDGFSRFVFESKIPDEATLKKEIQSMRKTALAAGFSEQEVATVYDPRMLSILRKASKYDRMMAAAKPQAVVPGKGRTLTPGSATPIGNAPRKGLDEASRRLANSGRLDDAAEVFRRML
jgi:hypothetical protein